MKKSEIELKLFEKFIANQPLPIGLTLRAGFNSIFDPYKSWITNLQGPLGYKLRQLYWKRKFKKFGKNLLIDVGVLINGPENVSILDFTWIDAYSILYAVLGEINIGRRVHVAQGALLVGGGGLIVEDYAAIAPGVKLFSNTATPKEGKRMSGPMIPEKYKAFVTGPIRIKKDAFIGANSVVLPGVTVGEGAVVGANSVVHRDIPPYAISIGIPARIIGRREKITVPDI